MKTLKFVWLFSLTLFFTNCSEEESFLNQEEGTLDLSEPESSRADLERRALDQLRYNHVSFKGSHNSYERRESITEQLSYNSNAPHNNGCLGLEFDIWRTSSNFQPGQSIQANYWRVAHFVHPQFGGGPNLSTYLNEIKGWHNNNPNHYPVMIKLDIKSSGGGWQNFHEAIDTYLRVHFGAGLIYYPNLLFTENGSLRHNVSKYGWPTMNQLRGKFIFVLTGNAAWGEQYANTYLNHRLCFTMKTIDAHIQNNPIGHANNLYNANPNIVFYNFDDAKARKNKNNFKQFARHLANKRMITRTYSPNNASNWAFSRDCAISCISTDKVKNHNWARIHPNNSSKPFALRAAITR